MKKQDEDRSGVVRCQRCFKYGHYTYECQNDVAYRYRPSRTVLFKEKIKLQLMKDKAPKTVILNPDYKRRVIEDKPSSQSEGEGEEKQKQNKEVLKKEKEGEENLPQRQQPQEQASQEEEESESSSSSESSESSSSSSSSEDSQEEKKPRKIRKLS